MPYSLPIAEEKTARAYGRELRTSWKNAINVTRAIKGMKARAAESFLEDVIALRKPVKFTVRNRKVAHRRGAGFGPGRFPKKSASRTLDVLRNAINNAEYQNLDPDVMVIAHASAYKGRTLPGWLPRAHGRATPFNEETCNIEIVLEEPSEDEEEA